MLTQVWDVKYLITEENDMVIFVFVYARDEMAVLKVEAITLLLFKLISSSVIMTDSSETARLQMPRDKSGRDW